MPEDDITREAARLSDFGPSGEPAQDLVNSLKETMWSRAGIIRDARGLRQGLDELATLRERSRRVSVTGVQDLRRSLRLVNTITASQMVCRAARLHRTESRGAHHRQDNAEQDDRNWLVNVRIAREDERMALSTEPVKLTRLSP